MGIFAFLDPDPETPLNPDPIRIRIYDTVEVLEIMCIVRYCNVEFGCLPFFQRECKPATHIYELYRQWVNDPVVEFTDRRWMIQWWNSQTVCEWSGGGIHRQYVNDLVVEFTFQWFSGGINRHYVNDPVVEFTDRMWMLQWWISQTVCEWSSDGIHRQVVNDPVVELRNSLRCGKVWTLSRHRYCTVTVDKLTTILWKKAGYDGRHFLSYTAVPPEPHLQTGLHRTSDGHSDGTYRVRTQFFAFRPSPPPLPSAKSGKMTTCLYPPPLS